MITHFIVKYGTLSTPDHQFEIISIYSSVYMTNTDISSIYITSHMKKTHITYVVTREHKV